MNCIKCGALADVRISYPTDGDPRSFNSCRNHARTYFTKWLDGEYSSAVGATFTVVTLRS